MKEVIVQTQDFSDEPVGAGEVAITACILTNRLDERFKQAVASILPATEVLILDNESGGDWKELAHKYPQVKVVHVPGVIDDFAKVRLQGVAAATHNWVLFVDSDEVVPASAWKEFEEVIESGAAGASIIRRDVFLGKELRHSEGGNLRLLRLFQKQHVKITGRVHETVQVSGKTIDTNILFFHFAHNSLSEFLTDVSSYARLAATEKTTGKLQTISELLCYPIAKLFVSLCIRRGILDGWRGVAYAVLMSLHSLAVRIYRYETLLKK
jgi:glycosyltransferase involved in cell wall biosynthesis